MNIKKKLFLGVLSCIAFAVTAAEFRVTGKVTAPGLKDVVLCDGEKFHNLKSDGTFDITFSTDGTGFVYLLFPDTLQAEGKWSRAVVPGDNKIDFVLKLRREVPKQFTFIHGSDVQYDIVKRSKEFETDMKIIADIFAEYGAGFITFPGDLTEFGEIPHLQKIKSEIEKNNMTAYALFGGHDGIRCRPRLKNFTEIFGAPYFSYNFGNVHFISPHSEYSSYEHPERLRQPRWIANDLNRLPAGTKVIVITHQPWLVFDMISEIAKQKKLHVLGYLGAHTHYHNLYYRNNIPVLAVSPLRWHDLGSFTKKLRLVTVDPEGKISTSTRLMNQHKRCESTLVNGRQLFVRIADSVTDAQEVFYHINGKSGNLVRQSPLVWSAELSDTLPPGEHTLDITVVCRNGKWERKMKISNEKNVAWAYATGVMNRRFPRPEIRDGKVYIGIHSGELPRGKGGVLALDLASGKKLWEYRGADIACGVAADSNTVRALTVDGDLLTFDAASGKLLRTTSLPGDNGYRRTVGKLTIVNGKILVPFINKGAKLYCLDGKTDRILWKIPLGNAEYSTNYSVIDDIVYYNGQGCVGATKITDGKEVWRDGKGRWYATNGLPLISDGAVYFVLRACIRKYDAVSGKLLWEQKRVPASKHTVGGSVIKDGKLITSCGNAVVITDPANGKRLARINIQPLPASQGSRYQYLGNSAAPVIFKNKVYIPGDDGTLYELDIDGKKLVPVLKTGFAFKGDPVSDGEFLVLAGFDGIIYAIK